MTELSYNSHSQSVRSAIFLVIRHLFSMLVTRCLAKDLKSASSEIWTHASNNLDPETSTLTSRPSHSHNLQLFAKHYIHIYKIWPVHYMNDILYMIQQLFQCIIIISLFNIFRTNKQQLRDVEINEYLPEIPYRDVFPCVAI